MSIKKLFKSNWNFLGHSDQMAIKIVPFTVKQKNCPYLVAACWGGRSASQKVEHLSSGWQWHFAQSTYWPSLRCLSASQSSKHCLQRETRQRDGTGIRGPWGSQWPRHHRRARRKWRRNCSRDIKTQGPHCRSSSALRGEQKTSADQSVAQQGQRWNY